MNFSYEIEHLMNKLYAVSRNASLKFELRYGVFCKMKFDIIVPGDSIALDARKQNISIGPEMYRIPNTQDIIPSSAGIFNVVSGKQNSSLLYVDSNSKRYIPKENDYVIGIISGVYAEYYRVDLQEFSSAAQLSVMAFPNASKRNRPNLKVGQVIYARVLHAIPDIDVELSVTDPITGKEGGFGVLDEGGYVFDVNLNYARMLLFDPESEILKLLATRCKFEIAIGINGKVWIKCAEGYMIDPDTMEDGSISVLRNLKLTLAASKYLTKCQKSSPDEFQIILKNELAGLK